MLCCLAPGSAVDLSAQTPPRPEVDQVRFQGARALSEDRLAAAVATEATTCRSALFFLACRIGDFPWAERPRYLDPAELERDAERIETLYEIWGYPEAEATATVVPAGEGEVRVVFEIREGEPILVESLELRGLGTLSPPVAPPAPLPLRVGRPYALPLLEATQDSLRRALAERGRPYASVEVSGDVDADARTAAIVLTAVPGPPAVFGEVRIRAASPLDERLVRERLAFAEGQPFRPSALDATEEALYAVPAVGTATVAPRPGAAEDTVIPVTVAVSPRKLQGLELEGTVSSVQCLQVAAFWRHRYFLGGPRLFSLGAGISNVLAAALGDFPCNATGSGELSGTDYFVRADVLQPWPGHPRTTLLLRAFTSRESVPNVFLQSGYGATAGVSRRHGRGVTTSVTYSPERVRLDAAGIYFCGNFGICADEAIRELSEATLFAPLELLALWTPFGAERAPLRPPRDSPELAPAAGPAWLYWARAGAEAAGGPTLSESAYVRGLAEAGLTRRLGERTELATRLRAGWIAGDELLPPQVRLYGGGVDGVRGLPQNMLGAKALVVAESNLDRLGCDAAAFTCPAGLRVDPDLVNARPLGGTGVLEAGIEARYWLTSRLQAAAFVDYGALRSEAAAAAGECGPTGGWVGALAPGVGVRLLTDLGPIRVDVGYDTGEGGVYPLLTDAKDGGLRCLGRVPYRPFEFGDPSGTGELWRRLQIHVAIGQPF